MMIWLLKIINDPYQVVDEMVEGIVLAHSDLLKFETIIKEQLLEKMQPLKIKLVY